RCPRGRGVWADSSAGRSGSAAIGVLQHPCIAAAALARRGSDSTGRARGRSADGDHHHAHERRVGYRAHSPAAGCSDYSGRHGRFAARFAVAARSARTVESTGGSGGGLARIAAEIARQVRAFDPWPIAETQFAGEQLRIHKVLTVPATELPAGVAAAPGTITVSRDGNVLVACGAGALTLLEVQRPGRRPISARDWANTSDLAGRRLGQAS